MQNNSSKLTQILLALIVILLAVAVFFLVKKNNTQPQISNSDFESSKIISEEQEKASENVGVKSQENKMVTQNIQSSEKKPVFTIDEILETEYNVGILTLAKEKYGDRYPNDWCILNSVIPSGVRVEKIRPCTSRDGKNSLMNYIVSGPSEIKTDPFIDLKGCIGDSEIVTCLVGNDPDITNIWKKISY